MNERRDDLSTADLAAQQPADTAEPERPVDPDLERRDFADRDFADRDFADDELRRRDLGDDERLRDTTVVEDRQPDLEPVATPNGEAATGTAPDSRPVGATSAPTTGPLLDSQDAEGFRARWTDVQTGFVDAPRKAVEEADALVAELMQHLATTFADERGQLERQWDRGDDVPTDHLRDAFQRYRSFFERLLAT
jgi:hypothetical protein